MTVKFTANKEKTGKSFTDVYEGNRDSLDWIFGELAKQHKEFYSFELILVGDDGSIVNSFTKAREK